MKNKKLELRPYQIEAHEALSKHLKPNKSTLLCLPTGTGKTFTAASWLANKKRKTLWLAHRTELIDQAEKTFKNLGCKTSVWDADKKDASGDIVIASVLSTKNIENELSSVDTIVIDEAHHSAMESYSGEGGILDRVKHKRYLGLTATPTRLDGKELGFNTIAYQKTFYEMVEAGYLAKPNYISIRTGIKIDLKKVSGRFTQESLKKLNSEARNDIIAKTIDTTENIGKTLIFCVDIEHTLALQEKLKHLGAKSITQKNTKKQRENIVKLFKNGKIQILINCMIFVEGFDVPDINTVVLARPTESKVLYMQAVGRAARICEGKDSFNLIDIVDSDKHYGIMSEQWSMEELGVGEDTEEKRKTSNEVHEFAKQENINIDGLLSKFKVSKLNVIGLVKFKSFDNIYIFPITKDKAEALYTWKEHLCNSYKNVNNDLIYYYYTMYGKPAGFTLSEWKKIARAFDNNIRGRDRDCPLKIKTFCELSQLGTQRNSHNIIKSELNRIEKLIGEKNDEILSEIKYTTRSLVTQKVGDLILNSKMRYCNGIIEVNLGIPFKALKPFIPARLVIREVANETLDTEIIDVSYTVIISK